MARRPKLGRKIKHTKSLYRRKTSKRKKIISASIFVVAVAALCFLGYSIAPTIINYFRHYNSHDNNSSSKPWTPPEISSSMADDSSISDDSSRPEIDAPQSAVSYLLKPENLLSEQALRDAVAKMKGQGYTEIVAPLKVTGGELYFMTTNATATNAKAVKGTLTAPQIVAIIKEAQMIPVAQFSALKDYLVPRADVSTGYVFADTGAQWLDASPANGGKPWMSPFSDTAKTYTNELVDEISKAGFTRIITTDVEFPPFYPTDLDYIGQRVKDATRYKLLTDFAKGIQKTAETNGVQMLIQVPTVESLSGKYEVFNPQDIKQFTVSPSMDLAALPATITLSDGSTLDMSAMGMYDKVKTMLSAVSSVSGTADITPSIKVTGVSQDDVAQALKAFTDLSFGHYIITD